MTYPYCPNIIGSKAYATLIVVRIRILHVPGRIPGDIFTAVSGHHLEGHIDARGYARAQAESCEAQEA